jgi:porin
VVGQDERLDKPGPPATTTDADDHLSPTDDPFLPPKRLALAARELFDSPTLSGDWHGLRPRLQERGVGVQVFLNNQYQAIFKGGVCSDGSGKNAASMDAFFTFDLQTLGLIDRAEVLMHLQSNWGAGVNPRSGSIVEVNDDADGDLGLHVAQLWYRQHFLDSALSLTLGFLDFQTIIDRNEYANSEDKQFLNQALDNNPLVPLNIGLGAALTFHPTAWYTMIMGVGDAQSVLYKPGFSTAFHDENWWFAYMEHALHVRWPSPRGPLRGNYRVGLVYDPRPRMKFSRGQYDPPSEGSDYGLYVSIDQMVVRESDRDEQGLGLFGRFGYRTPETNRIARFYSGGLAYRGLIPGRDRDELGFGFAWLEGSSDFRRSVNSNFDREMIYEMYYAIEVAKWLVITPDIQYVNNPGAAGEVGHAIVGGLRVRISL